MKVVPRGLAIADEEKYLEDMKKPVVQLVKVFEGSQDEYEYNVLQIPCVQKYTTKGVGQFEVNGKTCVLGYVTANEIRNKKFPLNANPRKPAPKRVVSVMQTVLRDDPAVFADKNNGITIIASDVVVDGNDLLITFMPSAEVYGDGVCNGGHTYFAIETMPDEILEEALVKVEVIVVNDMTEEERLEEIKEIAKARNEHAELSSTTSANYTGEYDVLKKFLGTWSSNFAWYEGDTDAKDDAVDCKSLVGLMSVVSPFWYQHFMNDRARSLHGSALTGVGGVHKAWVEARVSSQPDSRWLKGHDALACMVREILVLQDLITKDFLETDWVDETKNTGINRTLFMQMLRTDRAWKTERLKYLDSIQLNSKGVAMTDPYKRMLIGLLRENVWVGNTEGGIDYVGWLLNPIELWREVKRGVIEDLVNMGSNYQGKNFANSFIRDASIVQMGKQLTRLKMGMGVDSDVVVRPWRITNASTGEVWQRPDSGQGSTVFDISWPGKGSWALVLGRQDNCSGDYEYIGNSAEMVGVEFFHG